MKTLFRVFSFVACIAVPAAAQRSDGVEIGMDASLSRYTVSSPAGTAPGVTVLELPVQAVRIGFPVSPNISLEPTVSLIFANSQGHSNTAFAADLGLVYSFSASHTQPQWFVRPLIGYQHNSMFAVSGSHAAAGIGGGVRVPATDRIALRFEARYRHTFEGGEFSENQSALLAGLSFFTR